MTTKKPMINQRWTASSLAIAWLLFAIGASGQLSRKGFDYGRAPSAPTAVPHPWRYFDGKPIRPVGTNWVSFGGKVSFVEPNGVHFSGGYLNGFGVTLKGEFFVRRFPLKVAEDDFVSGDLNYTARLDGTYNYQAGLFGKRTIHQLDYGDITPPLAVPSPPLTSNQIAAARAYAAEARTNAAARTLALHQAMAATNNPYGLWKMGLRYAAGDGVAQDRRRARELLARAAALGQVEASEALHNLPLP